MKIRTLALALTSLAAVFAAAPSAAGPVPAIGDTVAQLESRYPGKVVAIEFDDSGDKARALPRRHALSEERDRTAGRRRSDARGLHRAKPRRSRRVRDACRRGGAADHGGPGQMLVAELDAHRWRARALRCRRRPAAGSDCSVEGRHGDAADRRGAAPRSSTTSGSGTLVVRRKRNGDGQANARRGLVERRSRRRGFSQCVWRSRGRDRCRMPPVPSNR